MRTSTPFKSADGRATYVHDEKGTRYRVDVIAGQVIRRDRIGKAANKRRKRDTQTARRRAE